MNLYTISFMKSDKHAARQALLLSLVGSTLSNTNLRNHEVFARRDLGPNTAQTAKLRSALKPTL